MTAETAIEVRWPMGPLLAAAGVEVPQLPRRLKVSTQAVRRAAGKGLTDVQADRWACRLGWHPGAVWPEWFAEDAVRAAVAERVVAPKGRGSVTPWRSGWRVRIYAGKDHASRSRYLEGVARTRDDAEELRRRLLEEVTRRGVA